MSKSEYPVTFKSAGKNVRVKVEDKKGNTIHTGVTPTTTTLSAKRGYFKPAIYKVSTKQSTQELKATVDPTYYGNLLVGGFIGMLAVDAPSGAMWKLKQEVVVE